MSIAAEIFINETLLVAYMSGVLALLKTRSNRGNHRGRQMDNQG